MKRIRAKQEKHRQGPPRGPQEPNQEVGKHGRSLEDSGVTPAQTMPWHCCVFVGSSPVDGLFLTPPQAPMVLGTPPHLRDSGGGPG